MKIIDWNGDSIIKYIRLGTRMAEVFYERDWKSEIGGIGIRLKNGWWSIGFEEKKGFEGFGYLISSKDPSDQSIRNISIDTEHSEITKGKWLIRDYGCDFKILEREENEAEKIEELIEPKVTKSITQPDAIVEYYKRDKILRIPYLNEEVRLSIKNENLEYIRKNRKILKVSPLNKEIHLYGIFKR
ncbi:MAG: hypothetical protein QXL51_02640 [Candidatus Aenigmatarchaeota archaeon]